MRRCLSTPEFRLVVPGKPESFRAERAEHYKRRVQEVAVSLFASPLTGRLDVLIDYFHLRRRRMDMDNIAKCILDALTGIAYADDVQVALQSSVDHDLSTLVRISGCIDLVKPLAEHEEYVFIRIRDRAKTRGNPGHFPHSERCQGAA
jgi:Holliday junction resolvase RusA-like endonuclease